MPDCAKCNRPLGVTRRRNMRTGSCEECSPPIPGDRLGTYGLEDTSKQVELINQPEERDA